MMILEARTALTAFAVALGWNIVLWATVWQNVFTIIGTTAFVLFATLLLYINSTKTLFQIIWRSYVLGLVLTIGINTVLLAPELFFSTGLYLCVISFFHMSEYIATAFYNPSSLTLDSFIINHSREFNAALLLSFVEHLILMYFIPGMKMPSVLTYLGLMLCSWGEIFRKLAMFTAGKSFNHVVQFYKHKDHILVTSGVYAIVRHPSYTGWFCWSIGTQILLCNPICLIGYTCASWKFFHDRIIYEEMTLLNFFGRDYLNYKKKVPSGIPFVKGYVL
uniref:Protein-S-isoprenylcysteine O-methyltransferase n=1 Tax=Phallusia mammillata TaxID=59560 RepID=A0A6F9DFL7_9ASCI|nr:protein-S-isoprenylcysteine O-methyltransferase-like [Phallusia mammillata]